MAVKAEPGLSPVSPVLGSQLLLLHNGNINSFRASGVYEYLYMKMPYSNPFLLPTNRSQQLLGLQVV